MEIKNLHICPRANYVTVNGYIKLINENFNPEDHFFLVIDTEENPLQKVSQYNNVVFVPDTKKNWEKTVFGYAKKAVHVYFHSIGYAWTFQAKMLLKPWLMKKSTWIEWGADLYDWHRSYGNPIRRKITDFILKKWRKNVASVVFIYPADEKVYRREFSKTTPGFHAIYSLFYHEDMYRTKPEKPLSDGKLHVLVGHSAVRNCHHEECFDALAHFKDENIVLHVPLNYGDMSYRDEVMKKAREIFPEEKLDFILENVPLDEYVTFLWNVDVGVFCVERQIALGNICKLLYACKKVYLPKGSLMYDCFTEKETEVYDFNEIKNETFEEFSRPCKNKEPSDYMKGRMTKENVLSQWKTVFDTSVK